MLQQVHLEGAKILRRTGWNVPLRSDELSELEPDRVEVARNGSVANDPLVVAVSSTSAAPANHTLADLLVKVKAKVSLLDASRTLLRLCHWPLRSKLNGVKRLSQS